MPQEIIIVTDVETNQGQMMNIGSKAYVKDASGNLIPYKDGSGNEVEININIKKADGNDWQDADKDFFWGDPSKDKDGRAWNSIVNDSNNPQVDQDQAAKNYEAWLNTIKTNNSSADLVFSAFPTGFDYRKVDDLLTTKGNKKNPFSGALDGKSYYLGLAFKNSQFHPFHKLSNAGLGDTYKVSENKGIEHNGLDDAKHEAEILKGMFNNGYQNYQYHDNKSPSPSESHEIYLIPDPNNLKSFTLIDAQGAKSVYDISTKVGAIALYERLRADGPAVSVSNGPQAAKAINELYKEMQMIAQSNPKKTTTSSVINSRMGTVLGTPQHVIDTPSVLYGAGEITRYKQQIQQTDIKKNSTINIDSTNPLKVALQISVNYSHAVTLKPTGTTKENFGSVKVLELGDQTKMQNEGAVGYVPWDDTKNTGGLTSKHLSDITKKINPTNSDKVVHVFPANSGTAKNTIADRKQGIGGGGGLAIPYVDGQKTLPANDKFNVLGIPTIDYSSDTSKVPTIMEIDHYISNLYKAVGRGDVVVIPKDKNGKYAFGGGIAERQFTVGTPEHSAYQKSIQHIQTELQKLETFANNLNKATDLTAQQKIISDLPAPKLAAFKKGQRDPNPGLDEPYKKVPGSKKDTKKEEDKKIPKEPVKIPDELVEKRYIEEFALRLHEIKKLKQRGEPDPTEKIQNFKAWWGKLDPKTKNAINKKYPKATEFLNTLKADSFNDESFKSLINDQNKLDKAAARYERRKSFYETIDEEGKTDTALVEKSKTEVMENSEVDHYKLIGDREKLIKALKQTAEDTGVELTQDGDTYSTETVSSEKMKEFMDKLDENINKQGLNVKHSEKAPEVTSESKSPRPGKR